MNISISMSLVTSCVTAGQWIVVDSSGYLRIRIQSLRFIVGFGLGLGLGVVAFGRT